jgi:hypothetical protein
MYDVFNNEPQFLFALIAVCIVFGVPAITILGAVAMRTWRKHQATKMEIELKHEMVAAGMSAAEIERILAAKPHHT